MWESSWQPWSFDISLRQSISCCCWPGVSLFSLYFLCKISLSEILRNLECVSARPLYLLLTESVQTTYIFTPVLGSVALSAMSYLQSLCQVRVPCWQISQNGVRQEGEYASEKESPRSPSCGTDNPSAKCRDFHWLNVNLYDAVYRPRQLHQEVNVPVEETMVTLCGA